MASPSFEYADYHRTVLGFHGTTSKVAEALVNGRQFKDSENDDDWFGKGIHFWEYAPKQAWWWAKRFKKHSDPAVIGAIIRLGNCFDLLDAANVRVMKDMKDLLVDNLTKRKIEVPKNFRQHRKLDCAVFNYLYAQAIEAKTPIDSARAVYVPVSKDKRIWEGSWIYEESHIQVCVRNSKNILAVWHVNSEGRYGK